MQTLPCEGCVKRSQNLSLPAAHVQPPTPLRARLLLWLLPRLLQQ
jgi:hypothetical protein